MTINPIATGKAQPDQVAVVIVTFNRPDFLRGLLDSIAALDVRPGKVIVIDNASSAPTVELLAEFSARELGFELIVKRLASNSGGAGGFAAGTEEALRQGAEWLWLMDDDVVMLPDGLSNMLKWTDQFRCFHAGRLDSDGSAYFCEQYVNNALAVQIPFFKDPYQGRDYFTANYGCFEGMMVHRDIVEKIGLPDARFFIVWDDATYGWLAARETPVAFLKDKCLQKVRVQRQISLGVRHLNDASDLTRYYAMRNRKLIKEYFKKYNAYVPGLFQLGTLLVFAKEMVRLLVVERKIKGVGALFRGWRAS